MKLESVQSRAVVALADVPRPSSAFLSHTGDDADQNGFSQASARESDWDGDNRDNGRDHFSQARPLGEVKDDGADVLAAEIRGITSHSSNLKDLVVQASYKDFQLWFPTVCYIALPEDRLRPRSRINSTDWFVSPESLALLNSTSGVNTPREQTVRMFRPDGYFHLACPFFAADPVRHRSCVLEGRDLLSISAVLRHISEHHPWRAYCARCHRDFDSPEARDAHMAERSCEFVGYPAPQGDASRKGVSDDEVRQLRRMDLLHSHKSEAERWRRIYWKLFPDLWAGDEEDYNEEEEAEDEEEEEEAEDEEKEEEAEDEEEEEAEDEEEEAEDQMANAASDNMDGDEIAMLDEECDPYLRSGNGYAVSLVHDFWAQHRRECVTAALEAYGHGIDKLHDDKALKALYQATLEGLIHNVYQEYRLHGGAA